MAGNIRFMHYISTGVLFLLSICSDCRIQKNRQAAGIEMELQSLQGAPLIEAGVGVPFLIKVKVSGENGRSNEPKIEGIFAQRVGIQMQSVNGFSTTTYTYKALINEPGEFDIGPAIMQTPSGIIESSRIRLSVVEEENISTQRSKKVDQTQKTVFAQLWVDESEVYVNQCITLTLRCYFLNSVSLHSIIKPVVSWLDIADMHKPVEGTEQIGSALYHYIEWQWNAYPKEAGDFVVPAFGINAEIDTHTQNSGLFSHMPLFFAGFMNEQVQIHSNGVSIKVRELSAEAKKIGLVGDFSALSMHIDPTEIAQEKAAVLKLVLKGKSGVERVGKPTLCDMPQSIRWYYSKESVKGLDADGYVIKEWEFVLQPLDAGNFIIPAQKIVYFDTMLEKIRMLKTDTVTLKVNPSTVSSAIKNNVSTSQQEKVNQKSEQKDTVFIWQDSYRPIHSREPFSWGIFWMLCVMIWMAFFYQSMVQALYSFVFKSRFLQKNILVFRALIFLKHAQRKNDPSRVYYIFEKLYKEISCKSALQRDKKEQSLELLFVSYNNHLDEEWSQFIQEAMYYTFGGKRSSYETIIFFKHAQRWLHRIRKGK